MQRFVCLVHLLYRVENMSYLPYAQAAPPPYDSRIAGNGFSSMVAVSNNIAATSSSPRQVLQVFLPSTYSSWSELPMNPLDGLPGTTKDQTLSTATLPKEEYRFYCDPCQKGFHSQGRFDEHMQDHVYCTVEGCHFTCRKSKMWKLELHMETLHNRPDAPQLHDVGAYVAQRKKRFPTTETVRVKVEELFYRAARGEVLPDERRRWMRQHGVLIKKRPREETTYISSNAHRSEATHKTLEAETGETDEGAEQQGVKQQPKVILLERPALGTGDGTAPCAPAPRRPKLIPEGPDGRLSRSQKVQIVREKYRDATLVPKFYVCNRCGEKGSHWVAACPTMGDARFDRNSTWGEDRRLPLAPSCVTTGADGMTPSAVESSVVAAVAGEEASLLGTSSGLCLEEEDKEAVDGMEEDEEVEADIQEEDLPAVERSAKDVPPSAKQNSDGEIGEYVRTIQPVAAMRLRGRRVNTGPRQRRRVREPSLFEKLTVDEGLNDKGLLLQAIRFFSARNFFQGDGPTS